MFGTEFDDENGFDDQNFDDQNVVRLPSPAPFLGLTC